ncbi:MAG TPA: PilN domain-containing protein [Tepidisphaeraceae bacterium]|nr:PilN domain-containing protein [Tepidisphaeraceae bacterium]
MSLAVSINLIPKARQAKAERRRRLRWWSGAWGIYAAALVLGAGMMYLRFSNVRDLSAELDKQKHQITALQTESQQADSQLLEASQKLLSAKGLLEQPDWSQLMSILADLRGNDVVLEDIQLALTIQKVPAPVVDKKKQSHGKAAPPPSTTKWELQLTGHGKTPESVSQFVLRLERTDLFDRVNLLKTSSDPLGVGDATSFSIECPLKGRGRAWE